MSLASKIVPALVLVGSLAAAGGAGACAMYKPPRAVQAEAYLAEAQKAEKQGEPRLAIRQFERAMNEAGAPSWLRAEAAFEAGRLRAQTGDKATARARLELAATMGDGRAYFALGKLLAGDDDAAAVPRLRQALQTALADRDRATTEALLAFSLARTGAAKEAGEHLDRARALKADAKLLAAAEVALRDARDATVAAKM